MDWCSYVAMRPDLVVSVPFANECRWRNALNLDRYGWAAHYDLNIAAPMVANFFFGVGSMIIFNIATTMLTEFMPKKASNGVALNNV